MHGMKNLKYKSEVPYPEGAVVYNLSATPSKRNAALQHRVDMPRSTKTRTLYSWKLNSHALKFVVPATIVV